MVRKQAVYLTSHIIGLGLVGVMVLSACASNPSSVAANLTPASPSQQQESLPTYDTATTHSEQINPIEPGYPTPMDEVSERGSLQGNTSRDQDSPTSDPSIIIAGYPQPEQISPPPPKSGLEATDPSTVDLSSGSPQLVEFFAFW